MARKRLGIFYRRRAYKAAKEAYLAGGDEASMTANATAEVEGLGLPPWLVAILVRIAVELLRKWLEKKLSSPPEFDPQDDAEYDIEHDIVEEDPL
jgi:hypothetical protein